MFKSTLIGMFIRSFWIFVLTSLAITSLVAKPKAKEFDLPPPQDAFGRCSDLTEGSDRRALDCIDTEQARLDALLHKAYRSAMTKLSYSKQKALRLSQPKWIARSARKCSNDPFVKANEGGTAATVEYAFCILIETQERLDALLELAREARQ